MSKEIQSIASVHDLEKSPQTPGKKSWKSKFQLKNDDSPPEIYNWTLYGSIFVFGILGMANGFDEGNIAGAIALPSFTNQFGLTGTDKSVQEVASLKGNITAMVQLGCIGGAMLAMYTVDKFGRVRALQGVCVAWLIAAVIQITASSVGQLYAGRLLEGLALGQTCTIGPSYNSEVAPKAIRGMAGAIFSGAVYFGIMIGYSVSYGAVLHISSTLRLQWMLGIGLKFVIGGLIFIASFLLCYESPRWLLKVGKADKAIENLSKLRRLPADHPYIIGEISDINEQVLMEKEASSRSTLIGQFKDLFLVKSIRYRFWGITFMAQLLGQWSGATSITIYSSELFVLVGITGPDKLKMSVVFGIIKFVSGYASAFFVIDFLGRRRALYIGICIQLICILYFAIFLTIVPTTEVLTSSQQKAANGALAALFLSGVGWTMGFNCIQYLIGSEIFPLYMRSFAQSLTMVVHFVCQYGNNKALPKMLLGMHVYGAFYFFVGVMVVGLFWCWFFLPEVAGRSLESMEEIFNLPWYLIGRKGPELCPDFSEINKIHYTENEVGNTYADHIQYDIEKSKVSQDFVEDNKEEEEKK